MLKTVLSPSLVGLHLVTIAVLASFVLLGRWQLGVFEDSGAPRAARDPAPVGVTTLSEPGRHLTADAVSRRVTAEGTFDADRQVLVTGRDGGFWVLAPLDLADGTALPVVRGWVAQAGDPATVPGGKVAVAGRLRPSEQVDSVRRDVRRLPDGQLLSISTAELVNVWQGKRLRDGYVVASAQTPAPAVPLKAVAAEAPREEGPFNWRNLAYALNWWLFGAFAVFMWFHFVRDAVRSRKNPPPAPQPVPLSESATR
ncbi:SURF1 family protein [Streptosporangium sp. KLBMP 9127]|nr:SURF1 family protein [Streptosporangium sp. KLBMP 9127]